MNWAYVSGFDVSLRVAAFAALFAIAACGGGGVGAEVPTVPPAVPSGKLDPTFGIGGKVTLSSAGGIQVAADGNLLVAGSGITKLDAAGTSIATYGQAPSTFYQLPVLDEGGNLYVYTQGPGGPSIAKFDAGGQRVMAFGVDGLATLPYGSNWVFDPASLARDAAGNLFLVGTKREDLRRSAMVAKFDHNGRRVDSFGSAGVQLIEPGGRIATGLAAAVDPEGRLFVAGWAAPSHDLALTMFVAKLGVDGVPAGDFGAGDLRAGGFWLSPPCATTTSPAQFVIETQGPVAIAVDSAGAILLGGRCRPPGSHSRPVIFKLDSRGLMESAFRDAGLRPDLFGAWSPDEAELSAVGVLRFGPGGSIYAGGSKRNASVLCGDFALAKLSASGEPVRDFGTNGVVLLDVAGDRVTDVAFDRESRLYMSGSSFGGCPNGRPFGLSFTIYRLGS